MKKLLLTTSILLLAAACNKQAAVQPAQNQAASTSEAVQTQPQATSTPEISDWQVYTSSEYGFQLTLTDAWKGYKVFTSEGSQGVGSPQYIEFAMPTTDKSQFVNIAGGNIVYGYSEIFVIIIKDKTQELQGTLITSNATNNYSYIVDTELPSQYKSIDFGIPTILSSFKLTK